MIQFLKRIFGNKQVDKAQALSTGAVIIDVRTPAEFEEGHLLNARNIPLNELKANAELIRSWKKPVITVCRSGSRSGIAKSILEGLGIKTINGGAWNHFKI
jgi:phage shock protein E